MGRYSAFNGAPLFVDLGHTAMFILFLSCQAAGKRGPDEVLFFF